jgi:hypothetical protein
MVLMSNVISVLFLPIVALVLELVLLLLVPLLVPLV